MPVLTSSIINNAEIKDKIYYIWDDMVKGFALKVIPNGQKKYVIKYRTSMGGRKVSSRWSISENCSYVLSAFLFNSAIPTPIVGTPLESL